MAFAAWICKANLIGFFINMFTQIITAIKCENIKFTYQTVGVLGFWGFGVLGFWV